MIKIEVTGLNTKDLTKKLMSSVEKKLVDEAKRAAARHGGVKVQCRRGTDGIARKIEFEGSEAGVGAVKRAISKAGR